MQAWFGDDWGVDYPKEFVNNGSLHATNTSNWGFRVDGGVGERRLVNNYNILGAGGPSESASGGHALYINSTGLKVWNNWVIYSRWRRRRPWWNGRDWRRRLHADPKHQSGRPGLFVLFSTLLLLDF